VNKTPSKPSLRAHARVAVLVPGALVAGVLLASPASAATTTVSVCSVGCDFTTISSAVSAASAGDTIDVQGGTYTESVAVSKPLTIRATTPGTTVVPGPGFNDPGFKLQADDVTIQGFTIGDRSAMNQTVGIDVASTNGTRIVDDIIVNNQRGVSLSGASDTVVSGTRFSDNNGSGPDNNAGLWGDALTGLTVENSTFVGHTNTAVNVAGSSHITITGSRFDDNGNVAVIWGDTDVTVSYNVGTMMRGSGVYLNQSSNVTISGNDLAARGGISAVSVNNVTGPNSAVLVTHNVLRDFARGVGIANGALSDPLVASGNAFLTTTAGVRNLGSTLVDARGNWWGAASGPVDPTASDSSLPETNSGTGVSAEGAVDYRDWCVNDTCSTPVVPPVKATVTLRHLVRVQHDGDRVLVVRVIADHVAVTHGSVAIRNAAGTRVALLAVHHGKARANLGTLKAGKHVYTVVFRGTETAKRAIAQFTVRVH
jgi:parallel beta-helix repeat protein